jgi:hypothetical protein
VGITQLSEEIGQGLRIQMELSLKGTIGHPPAPLEHGDRLVEDLFKGHHHPSL